MTFTRSLLEWRFGADVGPLSISAQEFAYDNIARLLANELSKQGRSVRAIRFPRKDVPASMMPFLALDDSREEAIDRLVEQAGSDADLTKSACDDPGNQDGRAIKSLLESLPPANPSRLLYNPGAQAGASSETGAGEN